MGFVLSTQRSEASGGTAITEVISRTKADLGERAPALVFVFASAPHSLPEVSRGVADAFPAATVVGASSSGEFVAPLAGKGAVVTIAVVGDVKVYAALAEGLSADVEAAVDHCVAAVPNVKKADEYPHRTAIVLLDALSGRGEEAALLTAAMLGPNTLLAGGAAADDLQMVKTTVALGGRSASDALVVAVIASREPLGVGVSHGHAALSAPMKVTKAEGSLLQELDGRPAWDAWKDAIREHAKAQGHDVDALAPSEEGAFLLRYEVGLSTGRGGTGLKVRAPLSREGTALRLACGVPEGALVRVTESTPLRQIESAAQAARLARQNLAPQPDGTRSVAGAVVFDCVCRALILDHAFADAVSAMAQELGGAPVGGWETYGEIAMNEGDLSGFHNTTSVVLAFPS
jgi:methyl-accepting chemotaxis protein